MLFVLPKKSTFFQIRTTELKIKQFFQALKS